MRISAIILIISVLFGSCDKQKAKNEGVLLTGTWVREGTTGAGPGNTIVFSQKMEKIL